MSCRQLSNRAARSWRMMFSICEGKKGGREGGSEGESGWEGVRERVGGRE